MLNRRTQELQQLLFDDLARVEANQRGFGGLREYVYYGSLKELFVFAQTRSVDPASPIAQEIRSMATRIWLAFLVEPVALSDPATYVFPDKVRLNRICAYLSSLEAAARQGNGSLDANVKLIVPRGEEYLDGGTRSLLHFFDPDDDRPLNCIDVAYYAHGLFEWMGNTTYPVCDGPHIWLQDKPSASGLSPLDEYAYLNTVRFYDQAHPKKWTDVEKWRISGNTFDGRCAFVQSSLVLNCELLQRNLLNHGMDDSRTAHIDLDDFYFYLTLAADIAEHVSRLVTVDKNEPELAVLGIVYRIANILKKEMDRQGLYSLDELKDIPSAPSVTQLVQRIRGLLPRMSPSKSRAHEFWMLAQMFINPGACIDMFPQLVLSSALFHKTHGGWKEFLDIKFFVRRCLEHIDMTEKLEKQVLNASWLGLARRVIATLTWSSRKPDETNPKKRRMDRSDSGDRVSLSHAIVLAFVVYCQQLVSFRTLDEDNLNKWKDFYKLVATVLAEDEVLLDHEKSTLIIIAYNYATLVNTTLEVDYRLSGIYYNLVDKDGLPPGVVPGKITWPPNESMYAADNTAPDKVAKFQRTYARAQRVSCDALVPQDGRLENYADPKFTLRAGTTLLHARVNLSETRPSSASDVFSKYFGLTLSHPCTVLLLHILVDADRPTGPAVLFEYETLVPLGLRRNYGAMKYDEVYIPELSTDTLAQSMRVVRAYNIDRQLIEESSILAFMHGNDGSTRSNVAGRWQGEDDGSQPGRWREDVPSTRTLQRVSIGNLKPRFDADYLHMRQFWQKNALTGMTLQAILCGSDVAGPPHMKRHAFYIYDTQQRFVFNKPVVYRDEEPNEPRRDMPYVVALVVAFTGTRNYDSLGGFKPRSETAQYTPIRHQGEIIGIHVEKGYEDRVYPLIDAELARLPWEPDHPVRADIHFDRLPLFMAALGQVNASIV